MEDYLFQKEKMYYSPNIYGIGVETIEPYYRSYIIPTNFYTNDLRIILQHCENTYIKKALKIALFYNLFIYKIESDHGTGKTD